MKECELMLSVHRHFVVVVVDDVHEVFDSDYHEYVS
jgi:hypothetical protein